ncbi:TonB-dependent receptor [Edaphobacter albus]|uniref:TonB-dependent receptor n=1 Tax=Edaphobacter sp. 4G125 TaxID=2763071 RepID=UPI001647EF17|nr:carboxypeptidase regulatory-like domain-containing protein [Edaphobacter sp. 4G125]QNI35331.1 TonB-dependent receptor [Edaphobacter sp. 4G125]
MFRTLSLSAFVAFFFFGFLSTHQLHAQSTTASMLGVVHDSSGAVIPGAEVTVTNAGTSFTRTIPTDNEGGYLFTNLPIGAYELRATMNGFQTFVQTGITLVVNQNARVDITLSLGAASQTVQVDAQVNTVDTHSAVMGELVDRERIQELPLNGRNAMQLAAVVPGVTNILAAPTVQTQSRSGPSITVAGGRDTQNEFRFDGASWKNITQNTALNLPNPDALQEFQILTSSPSAEYGRNSGGIFIAVTRAGTNKFHGSAYDYLRNTALNARNYFTRPPNKKPTLIQNQFGGTLGGPIIRNKLFGFFSYQGTRIHQTQILAPSFVPTQAQRNGMFTDASGNPLIMRDPIRNSVYVGQIPTSDFDPTAVRILNQFVASSPTGSNVSIQVPNPSVDDQYVGRADYNVTQKDSLYVRYFRDKGTLTNQAGTFAPYATSDTSLSLQSWVLGATHAFSSSLLNELRLSVARIDSNVTQKDTRQLSDFGANFPGVISPQLPNINISGFINLNVTDLFNEHDNIYQLGDTFRWTHGKHSISVGGEIERLELYNFGSSGNNGTFTFNGTRTAGTVPNPSNPGSTITVTGNAFADFLIGRPATLLQASPYHRNAKTWDGYAFVQDDYRLTDRVTLNLGLRYSIFQPFGITGNRTNTFRAGQQSTVVPSAPLGMVFPGDRNIQNGLVATNYTNIAPRIGVAYDPLGNGRMSIRAAYGLFFEDLRSDIFTYAAVNQPFVISNTLNVPSSLTDPYRGTVDPFPYTYNPSNPRFTFPMSLFTVLAPTLNSPYVHNISASIQQEIFGGMQFNIGYVGKLEHGLVRMTQANPAVYGPGATLANTDARRPLLPGTYASVRVICMCSPATYHSMQTSLSKNYSNGLTFKLAYTWGKLLDQYSATNLGQFPQDPANPAADRARSDFDRRSVFSGSIVYQIPFYKNANPVLRQVFSNWSVNSLIQMSSGLPFNVVTGRDASLTGVGYDRPNVVGNPQRSSYSNHADKLAQFFNKSAYVANNPGQYGNSGRNSLSGPGLQNVNLSLVRSFPLGERYGKVQFRSEFFNALNHANFGQPDSNFNNFSTSFASIRSASDPRIMQFALRYQF